MNFANKLVGVDRTRDCVRKAIQVLHDGRIGRRGLGYLERAADLGMFELRRLSSSVVDTASRRVPTCVCEHCFRSANTTKILLGHPVFFINLSVLKVVK